MRIGVLGSGLMGSKLGTIFARAGHQVVFSYSRSRQKLDALARGGGKHARAGTPEEAARGAEVLLLAVHWDQVNDVLEHLGDLADRTVVTCSLPMNADNSALVVGGTSSGAEELGRRVPTAHVVSAFGTVPSEVLFAAYAARSRTPRPSLVYCGDNAAAKELTATLIRDTGFDPLDVGPLSIARYVEPFALLMGQMAYEGGEGPALAYRIERFEEREGVAG